MLRCFTFSCVHNNFFLCVVRDNQSDDGCDISQYNFSFVLCVLRFLLKLSYFHEFFFRCTISHQAAKLSFKSGAGHVL